MIEGDGQEMAHRDRNRQPEQLGQEPGGLVFIARRDNGVIQRDGHYRYQSSTFSYTVQ